MGMSTSAEQLVGKVLAVVVEVALPNGRNASTSVAPELILTTWGTIIGVNEEGFIRTVTTVVKTIARKKVQNALSRVAPDFIFVAWAAIIEISRLIRVVPAMIETIARKKIEDAHSIVAWELEFFAWGAFIGGKEGGLVRAIPAIIDSIAHASTVPRILPNTPSIVASERVRKIFITRRALFWISWLIGAVATVVSSIARKKVQHANPVITRVPIIWI